MTKTLIAGNRYRFDLTDAEAARRVWECLAPTNPELRPEDVVRSAYAPAFVAHYERSDGEHVYIAVNVPNLKRYFGAFILGFTDGGIWLERRLSNKHKGE